MKKSFDSLIKSKTFKKWTVTVLIIEAVLAILYLVGTQLEPKYEMTLSGMELTGDDSDVVPIEGEDGTRIFSPENDPEGVLGYIQMDDYKPGAYQIEIEYSGEKLEDDDFAWFIIRLIGSEKFSDIKFLKGGDHKTFRYKFFAEQQYTEYPVGYYLYYSGASQFELHEITITRQRDLLSVPIAFMLLTLLGYILYLFGDYVAITGNTKEKWRTITVNLTLIGFGLSFISSLFVPAMGFALISGGIYLFYHLKDLKKEGKSPLKHIISQISWVDYALWGLILVGLIGSAFAKYDKTIAFGAAWAFVFFYLLFVLFRSVYKREEFLRIFKFIIIALVYTSIFCLIHYYVVQRWIGMSFGNWAFSIPDAGWDNIASLLEIWPTRGGYKLAFTISMVIFYIVKEFKNMKGIEKAVSIFAVLISLFVMAQTHARGAFLFILVAIPVFGLLKFKVMKAAMIVFTILVLAGGLYWITANEKIKQTVTAPLEEFNIQRRIFQVEVSLEMFKEHPNKLTGIGIMNFKPGYANYSNSLYYEDTDFVHNIYIALLLETGFLGLGSFIIFLVVIGIRMFKSRRSFIGKIGLSMYGAFILTGMVSSMFIYGVPVGIFMWSVFGLSQNKRLLDEEVKI